MLVFILIIVIAYTFILRKKLLKDKMQYIYYRDIPSSDSPAFVGKIVKGHTDGNDIIATILDLNRRNKKKRKKSIIFRKKCKNNRIART